MQTVKYIYKYIKEGEKGRNAGKCPWLEPDDGMRNMSDREILDRYVDLDNHVRQIQKRNKLWICYTNIKTHSV